MQCPLSSSFPSCGDPFPPVFVMEAAENRASRDVAVLGEVMSIVTLPRQAYRRGFRNPRSEAQMGAPLVIMSVPRQNWERILNQQHPKRPCKMHV